MYVPQGRKGCRRLTASRRFWATWMLGVLATVVLIGCGGGGGSSPGVTVRQFFTLGCDGKVEQALKHVVPESQHWATGVLSVSLGPTDYGIKLTSVAIQREEIRGTEATVHYGLRFSDTWYNSTDQVLRLVKREGRWQIVESESFPPLPDLSGVRLTVHGGPN